MYNPTPWKDHVTNPSNCFNITKNDDGTYQITRAGTVMQQGTPQDAAHFTNQEDGIWELFACYGLLLNYARQMGWDVERGSINLTNTAKPYPFNNSQKTVALQMQRPSRDYIVITEASNVKGNLGQIEVSDQLSNGFKVAYTGSATAATINYIVIGGYMNCIWSAPTCTLPVLRWLSPGCARAPITCGAPRWSMAVCALPTAPAMWASTARSLAGLVWTMPRLVPGCVTRQPTAAA